MTQVPGVDFTTIGKIAEAYFKCVNDNGGINGRRIQYTILTEQLDPAQQLSLAKKFVGDGVVGIVGNTSLTECGNTNKYYRSKGYYIIGAGVPGECFSSSNFAAVNMGPRYSNIGATQAILKRGAKSVVVSSPAAVAEYSNGGPALVANAAGVPFKGFAENLPLTDTDSIVQKLVQAAGSGGGVVLNYTPESATPLLKSAAKLGLIDKVIWGSSTPLNDNSVAAALGSAWAGKLNVNAELSLLDDPRPEMELYRTVSAKYNPDAPLGSFQQMGFMIGRIIVKTLLDMDPADLDDPVAVNAAIKGIKNFDTHIVCKPWYFGALPAGNVPNNWDYNVVPDGTDTMVLDKDCFAIAEVEPILTAVRAAEVDQGLNVGGG
jgi:branched-chain amino acid transport system substrate-binding protein